MGAHMISQWPSESSLLTSGGMSFIAALELSIAMPLSWLPLISDYTRESKNSSAITDKCYSLHGNKYCYVYLRSQRGYLWWWRLHHYHHDERRPRSCGTHRYYLLYRNDNLYGRLLSGRV